MSTTARYHISNDQVARKCQAKTVESCRATNNSDHFDTKEGAQQEIEKINQNKLDAILTKGPEKIHTYNGAEKYVNSVNKKLQPKMEELRETKKKIYEAAIAGESTKELGKNAVKLDEEISELSEIRSKGVKRMKELKAKEDALKKSSTPNYNGYSGSSCGSATSGRC